MARRKRQLEVAEWHERMEHALAGLPDAKRDAARAVLGDLLCEHARVSEWLADMTLAYVGLCRRLARYFRYRPLPELRDYEGLGVPMDWHLPGKERQR